MQSAPLLNSTDFNEEIHGLERGRCLLIKVDPIQLIVPRALIAEVIRYEGVALINTASPQVKLFNWRGLQVPLLDNAVINSTCSKETNEDSKIILFHGLLNHSKLPYYGFVATRNPRLIMVNEENIAAFGDQQDLHPSESAKVALADESAIIPKVDFLEKFILENI
jgi:chemotaxis signal transduction protein